MVEVDVFWSYGIGASLGLAAAHQVLATERASKAAPIVVKGADGVTLSVPPVDRWRSPYLLGTVLFLALLFAPSGLYLLWDYPSWETMHAGDRGLPAWLVTLFGITNVTQGILGFLVTVWLVDKGRPHLAALQAPIAYFGLFFILVHGWDGRGWERFFSPDHAAFVADDGADAWSWAGSGVAITLGVMGCILLPVLWGMWARWTRESAALQGRTLPGAFALAAAMGVATLGVLPAIAVVCHLLMVALGDVAGLAAFAVLAWFALLRPRHSLVAWLRGALAVPDRRVATPAATPPTVTPAPAT